MEIKTCIMGAFSVIGKEGSTDDGQGFIQGLWSDANSHFGEVASLAKKDEKGNIIGVWGLMSDLSRSFLPWEDFTKGLYLAGVEAVDTAEPPPGWVKWTSPAYEYLYVKSEGNYQEAFIFVLNYIKENGLALAGAVYDNPKENGELYLYFPIRRF